MFIAAIITVAVVFCLKKDGISYAVFNWHMKMEREV